MHYFHADFTYERDNVRYSEHIFCKNLLTITKNDVTLHFDDKSKEFSGVSI